MPVATRFSETTHGSASFEEMELRGPNNADIEGELLLPIDTEATIATQEGFIWTTRRLTQQWPPGPSCNPPELVPAPAVSSQVCWMRLANGYRLSYVAGRSLTLCRFMTSGRLSCRQVCDKLLDIRGHGGQADQARTLVAPCMRKCGRKLARAHRAPLVNRHRILLQPPNPSILRAHS